MINLNTFMASMNAALGHTPNANQLQAVVAPCSDALFIVAGPGTGKTATMTMRMLKLIFVDGLQPRGILATTFTKKAAEELRSRLLSQGYTIQQHLLRNTTLSNQQKTWLSKVDINQIRTGTIDSLCEEILRDHRDPGSNPPILADQFVSETLLLRAGLFNSGRFRDPDLNQYLFDARGQTRFGWHLGTKNNLVRTIWDRRYQDQLTWSNYSNSGITPQDKNALSLLDAALTDYATELNNRLMVDFVQLEQTVLSHLQNGGLKEFTNDLQVVFVDEYQDTNLLQERLYFEFAKCCKGAICVVGDDDQSLYRFRGSTVELFSNFDTRYYSQVGKKPKKIFLNSNYRSSQTIIDFVNAYAGLDSDFQTARVAGKPQLTNPISRSNNIPILGMFRANVNDLARDLASFVHTVTRGPGFRVGSQTIKIASKGGDVGDCALLCSSPQELSGGNPPKERLPRRLRIELAGQPTRINTFNPRGQEFSDLTSVQHLGGLLLECLDSGGIIQDATNGLPDTVIRKFNDWRDRAINWVTTTPSLKPLEDFATNWADRDPNRAGYRWPTNTSCLDLLYALIHWMPALHDDPEGQVYLEVFTRQLSAAEQVSAFKTRVVTDPTNQQLSDQSVKDLLLYFLAPIASGATKVDEELIDSFPRDRLSILSIHQSKGLEFPLTIVDVGSDFSRNHHSHAFKRFPRSPGLSQNLENLLRPHSPLNSPTRTGIDRSFDDLYRQYFVAFSRPQDVLLLVGLNATRPGGDALNVATGWDRREVNHWENALPFTDI